MPEKSGIESLLGISLTVASIVFVIWIALLLLGWWQRRAYNLSVAETTTTGGLKPEFLKVDTAARDAALQRGKAFDAMVQTPGPTPVTRAANYSGIIALIAAILSFITGTVAAVQKVQAFQTAVDNMSSWERFSAILSRYSAGFAIAALIIILQLLHFAFRYFKTPAA